MRHLRGIGLWLALSGAAVPGASMAEEHRVVLRDALGAGMEIARLHVAPDGAYTLRMAEAGFTDHFLSMRPFKCLEGPDKHWCHVPYPYENARNISADLVDLEYDLLFIWKGASEYGIDTLNGIYYVLAPTGAGFTGAVHEIDLGLLAVPPAPGELRPVAAGDLHEADPDSHWLPHLEITPVN
jgi:hypothetical protein